ncbi:hypothetical protein QA596_07800 [Balneolales bacterium ANBcel1]|nr:hypothetical protein [Balneolales bacterium ANBcel1]
MQTVKKSALLMAVFFLFHVATHPVAEAQNLRIVSINTLTGSLTGTALGGATMALQNKSDIDYYPLRFGLGMGTIFGLGVGLYDLSQSTGSQYYVDGLLAAGNTSGTIILMDTFYGAATGVIVGTAITLMTNSEIIKGVQYGAGTGAWFGFAFGLVDAFVLSTPGSFDSFYDSYTQFRPGQSAGSTGLITLESDNSTYRAGFLQPTLLHTLSLDSYGGVSYRTGFGIELTRIRVSL